MLISNRVTKLFLKLSMQHSFIDMRHRFQNDSDMFHDYFLNLKSDIGIKKAQRHVTLG